MAIQTDMETVNVFSKRSNGTVMSIAIAFALGGALMEFATSLLSAMSPTRGVFMPLLWGMWIPLCFITIPPIHYLCRQVKALQERIDELEKRSHEGIQG